MIDKHYYVGSGSWGDSPKHFYSITRFNLTALYHSKLVGFRLIKKVLYE